MFAPTPDVGRVDEVCCGQSASGTDDRTAAVEFVQAHVHSCTNRIIRIIVC